MAVKIRPSEITPEHLYLSRRKFITGAGAVLAGSLLLGGCGQPSPTDVSSAPFWESAQARQNTDELGDKLTDCQDVIGYNNFYEFSLNKDDVADLARDFKISPWTVEVSGLVNKPQSFSVDDLTKKFKPEERIYRLRCVEAWSMVIPWLGFPLSRLLAEVEPTSDARYVRFTTLYDPKDMPLQDTMSFWPWPYAEGLRLDEAMNDLAILATGLYGKPLPPQDGAPIRLVVPWKYGFKSIKSIVKIELVTEMPISFWMSQAKQEYGFYANVNPDVPHPRWSQASERRIGELDRRPTLLFNGYGDEVASLYTGMDLTANF
ncbi:MAG: protein-methionine-sulfoxide reductase catalytic subunit MsrP [Chloroflexota bacterium]